jgi:hypothetical protein
VEKARQEFVLLLSFKTTAQRNNRPIGENSPYFTDVMILKIFSP